mmetsp:Transcript_73545/g.186402  ORF Transcript_73545/g.186402 Transcript_73545/m.186402 type:complete len:419 (+) Transcript_73545:39-1295(+)
MDASVFAAVADTLTALPPALPSVLELARLGLTCSRLQWLCAQEVERRARARVSLAWSSVSGDSGAFDGKVAADTVAADEAHSWLRRLRLRPSEPSIEEDAVATAARYAGGWSALLAGREGLLSTQRQLRARGGKAGRGCSAQLAARDAVVIWDILRAGDDAIWSGVFPATPFAGNAVKFVNVGERIRYSVVYPQSAGFPGMDQVWKPCFECANFSSRRFQISGPIDDAQEWRHRVSVLAPGCAETHLSTLALSPRSFRAHGDSAFHPSLPEPTEISRAVDSSGSNAPGVFHCRFSCFKKEEDEWGFLSRWLLDLWIDSRSSTFHADVALQIEDRAWPAVLAHGRRVPRLLPRPSPMPPSAAATSRQSLCAVVAAGRARARALPPQQRRARSLPGDDGASQSPARRVAARRVVGTAPGR